MYYSNDELKHFGVLGMKWGVRRYQNKDGSLTAAGKKQYGDSGELSQGKKKLSTGAKVAIGVGIGAVAVGALVATGAYKPIIDAGRTAARAIMSKENLKYYSAREGQAIREVMRLMNGGQSSASIQFPIANDTSRLLSEYRKYAVQ